MPHTTNYWMTFIRFRFLSAFGLQVNNFVQQPSLARKNLSFSVGSQKQIYTNLLITFELLHYPAWLHRLVRILPHRVICVHVSNRKEDIHPLTQAFQEDSY